MNKNFLMGLLVFTLVAVGGYFAMKYSGTPTPAPLDETAVLATLENDWEAIQTLIPFRPTFHNQEANAKGVWRSPTALQFIGRNNLLIQFEDDSNVHVVLMSFKDNKFQILNMYENQGQFTREEWESVMEQYGNPQSVSTYTTGLVRNGEIVSFEGLTKIPENVFLKNYWEG